MCIAEIVFIYFSLQCEIILTHSIDLRPQQYTHAKDERGRKMLVESSEKNIEIEGERETTKNSSLVRLVDHPSIFKHCLKNPMPV